MIRYSEFDSELLKRSVARAEVNGLTADLLEQLQNEQVERGMEVVLIRDTGLDFSILHTLPWNVLRLSDIKVLLSTNELPPKSYHRDGLTLSQELRLADLRPLNAMVSQIAELSQYRKFFGTEVSLKLYKKWLENSLSGDVADYCYVVRRDDDHEPVAFVASKMEGRVAEATLVAVGARFKGIGIGQFLLLNVLHSLGVAGADSCIVASQISNHSALSFYNSLGFRFHSYRVDFILYDGDRRGTVGDTGSN